MLIRWNPWNEIDRMERDLLSFFDERTRRFAPLAGNGDPARAVAWVPAVDVREDAARIVLVADLPGVEDKDLSITIEGGVLTLRGERRAAPVEGASEVESHRTERVHGAFARSFTVPPTVDAEQVSADLRAGVLTLTLPKKPQAQTRQIKINA